MLDDLIKTNITHAFMTKSDVTDRTILVAEAFGLGIDDEKTFSIYEDFSLEYKTDDVILITGDSGSGKSWILNNHFKNLKSSMSVDELEIDDDEVVVEGVGKDLNDALYKLNIAGLGDAFLYLRKYNQLSDGQKYRYKVAKFIDKNADIWIFDEFCATLDRVTAKVVAFNLQKIARRLNKMVICATTHEDLLDSLKPNVHIFKGYESDAVLRRYKLESFSESLYPEFYNDIKIELGELDDYNKLKRFHYRQAGLGAVKAVYKMTYKDDVIGVIVITYPHLNLRGRNVYCNNRYGKMSKENCTAINERFECISRIVIHPKFRGIGLSKKLLNKYFEMTDCDYIETLAVMANYNPFFEKAGMTRMSIKEDEKRVKLLSQFGDYGFNVSLLSSQRYFIDQFTKLTEEEQQKVLDIIFSLLLRHKRLSAIFYPVDAFIKENPSNWKERMTETAFFLPYIKELKRADTVYLIKANDKYPALKNEFSRTEETFIKKRGVKQNDNDLLGEIKTIIDPKKPEKIEEEYKFNVDSKRCKKCLYEGRKVVPPEGDLETAKIMFVGEAPGGKEEDFGRPFIGPSGEYLKSVIKACELKEEDIYYTNACKCRPPGNFTPSDKERGLCKKYLMEEIKRFKGELIVLLGGTALKSVLGRGTITNYRGYGFQLNDHHIFCMYHPSYILRNKGTEIEDAFLEDMLKVYSFVHNSCMFMKGEHYEVVNTQDDLELMVSELDSLAQTPLSFDIETTGFDSSKDIVVSMSFATPNRCWVIPMEHEKSPWKGKTQWVVDQCGVLFKNKKFKHTGQNAKFDIKFMKEIYNMQIENLWFDTMIAHYILTGKFVPHGLKSMAWRYTNCGGYGLDRDDILQHDYEDILRYNAQDADITIRLMKVFWNEMSEEQRHLMTEIIAPVEQVIAEMELNGVKLDMDKLTKITDEYIEKVTKLEEKMHGYDIIQQIEKASDKIINFQSPRQLGRVLELMNIDTGKETAKTKAMSTDEEALKGVANKHDFIKDLLQLRKDSKVLGTYLKPYIENNKDGVIYSDYSFIRTSTGRLASGFQQVPFDTRSVFVSKNGWFLEVDYSQLELRVLAMLANDQPLIDAFQNDVDVHEITRFDMYGDNSNESDTVKKTQRRDAKTVNFGIVYLESAMGLSKDLGKSIRACQKYIDAFYNAHSDIVKYQLLVKEHVKKYGYIDTPFGRTRYFNLEMARKSNQAWSAMEREACNMPIQGTASDLVLTGIYRVWEEMKKRKFKSVICAEIHDSGLYDCYEEELEEICIICKDKMENISFDWMRDVPLKIDMAVGTHWGKLDEI